MTYYLPYLPNRTYSALEGQPSHQSATESQQLHSTDKSTLITGTAPNGSGSTPPECNKVFIYHTKTCYFH